MFALAVLRVTRLLPPETVSQVTFAPVKTLRDPTFPVVKLALAVFRVTMFALVDKLAVVP
jgi:hypothetical protein